MRGSMLKRALAVWLALSLANFGFVQSVGAAAIDTNTFIEAQDQTAAISRIQAQLSREDVRKALVQLGVDPAHAQARVSALTPAEVALLDQKLAELPAAGDAGWILLVALLAALVVLFALGKLRLN